MRIIVKREFEEGDVITVANYPWFAVRGDGTWFHTDFGSHKNDLSDDMVDSGLTSGQYTYVGKWTRDGVV